MHSLEELAREAKRLCDKDRADDAWAYAEEALNFYAQSGQALTLASLVAWKMRKFPLSYHLAVRATQLSPAQPETWMRLGIAAHEIWRVDESEAALKMNIRLARTVEESSAAHLNLCALYFDCGRYQEAEEQATKALKLSPESDKAKANLGMAQLAQRKWEGWDLYTYALGLPGRRRMRYGKEEPWDGTKGKTVVLYGEQGLGDELSFAQMVPEAIKDCGRVILDCDAKLEGIFRRSFPQAKVYGTRWAGELNWEAEDRTPDANCAFGELGKFYRRTDESFTGEAYLKADPIRQGMWSLEFNRYRRLGKPVIGIAWTGGMPWTGQRFRTLTLDQLKPLLQSVDAHWVCLQYKDAAAEIEAFRKKTGIHIRQYPWATLTDDYDDTAALVAELDLVVSIQTAIVHLCGALGKECLTLLPKHSQWKYGAEGDTTPWYKSVKIYRQRSLNDWNGPLGNVVGDVRKRYPAKEAA